MWPYYGDKKHPVSACALAKDSQNEEIAERRLGCMHITQADGTKSHLTDVH